MTRKETNGEKRSLPEMRISGKKAILSWKCRLRAKVGLHSGSVVTVFFSEGNTQQRGKVSYRDGYVTLPDGRLHYVDYGGTGELVVALHGFVQNAHAFDSIAPVLVPHVRLLALDMRGRGGSDWSPPYCYELTYYLRDLRDFLDSLRLSRFALIGTSMGGTLALLYSMAHPSDVTRLVLNDVTLNNNRAGVVRSSQRFGRAPAFFAAMSNAMAWFLEERDNLDSLDDEARLAWVSHFLTPAGAGGFRFNCDPVLFRLARQVRLELGPSQLSYRQLVLEQASRLTMPVLLLRGAYSDVVPWETARETVNLLPAATCVEVPGAGHSPTLYEPVAQLALREFFGIGGMNTFPSSMGRREQERRLE